MHELVLKECRTFYKGSFVRCDIGVDSGKISAIKKHLNGEHTIDCSHNIVFPGLIDVHVHFRVPGNETKETWKTASKAALHGGITTVLDMPNNNPAIIDERTFGLKEKIVSKDANIDYGLYIGVSDNVGKLKGTTLQRAAGLKLYMGPTTGTLLIDDLKTQRQAFAKASEHKKVLAVHAEDPSTIMHNSALLKETGRFGLKYHYKIRDAKAETIAVNRALKLSEESKASLHVCHVSSASAINALQFARAKGHLFSCGVTPHHLFLTNKDVEKLGNFAKVNPSIKTKKDREALLTALNSGLIDIIESDHAPHTIEEKQMPYENAPSGIPGMETMLPLFLDAYQHGLISLETIFNCSCANPARVFGIKNKGLIEVGNDADFCIVNLKREYKVSGDSLFTKSGWSPFEGRTLKGYVEKTILRGTLCFDDSELIEPVRGKNLFGGHANAE